ncbi:hypothetical protein BJ741DRAFT_595342 [Chytriomyces cf. hyalinus JEL632]|nr:hypothetical protein BJ741DRAFT_595342 [Chytriomyces cf. hyalinus JEL632]
MALQQLHRPVRPSPLVSVRGDCFGDSLPPREHAVISNSEAGANTEKERGEAGKRGAVLSTPDSIGDGIGTDSERVIANLSNDVAGIADLNNTSSHHNTHAALSHFDSRTSISPPTSQSHSAHLSHCSVTSSIGVGIDAESDDPIKLKDLLKVSRSANKKLEAQIRSLTRHSLAQRNVNAALSRTLASERESRFVKESVMTERLKQLELDVDFEARQNGVLRDRVLKLEDRIEDLKWRVCSGACFAAQAGPKSGGDAAQQKGSSDSRGHSIPDSKTMQGKGKRDVEYRNDGSPVSKKAVLDNGHTADSDSDGTGDSDSDNSNIIVSDHEKKMDHGSSKDAEIDSILDNANHTISSIGSATAPTNHVAAPPAKKGSFSSETAAQPSPAAPKSKPQSLPLHRDTFTFSDSGDTLSAISSSSSLKDTSFVGNTVAARHKTVESAQPTSPLKNPSPPCPACSAVASFIDSAVGRLSQELKNHVEWETAQMDLDELVAESRRKGENALTGNGEVCDCNKKRHKMNVDNSPTSCGCCCCYSCYGEVDRFEGSLLSSDSDDRGFTIQDAHCVLVILESFVSVLEDRVNRSWGQVSSKGLVKQPIEVEKARIRTEMDKLFSSTRRYDNLLSKYQPSDTLLLNALAWVCSKPSHLHTAQLDLPKSNSQPHSSSSSPKLQSLAPVYQRQKSPCANTSRLRPYMHLPFLMDFYKHGLVEVESILAWHALLLTATTAESPNTAKEQDFFVRGQMRNTLVDQAGPFVRWLEASNMDDGDAAQQEKLIDETMSENSDDERDGEECGRNASPDSESGSDPNDDDDDNDEEEDEDEDEDEDDDDDDEEEEDWDDDGDLLLEDVVAIETPLSTRKVKFAQDSTILDSSANE